MTIARAFSATLHILYTGCVPKCCGHICRLRKGTPISVLKAKKEASAIAEGVADKVDKVATPVLEAVAPKRVGIHSKAM